MPNCFFPSVLFKTKLFGLPFNIRDWLLETRVSYDLCSPLANSNASCQNAPSPIIVASSQLGECVIKNKHS